MTSDLVELMAVAGGVRLRLRVKPGARRSRLVKAHGGALKLEVTAPPERGKANAAVLALLAKALDLPVSCLAITAGTTSQDKTVEITGINPADLAARLTAAGI